MPNCDLAKLFADDRAKSPTEPWSEVELHAIYQLNIPADYVRKGFVTVEEYEKAKAEVDEALEKGDKPLLHCSREELAMLAGQNGASFRDGMSDVELMESVKEALFPPEVKPVNDPLAVEEVAEEVVDSLQCDQCDFRGKTENGLLIHKRAKHMEEVKEEVVEAVEEVAEEVAEETAEETKSEEVSEEVESPQESE